jgi:hypothetical protein
MVLGIFCLILCKNYVKSKIRDRYADTWCAAEKENIQGYIGTYKYITEAKRSHRDHWRKMWQHLYSETAG